MRASWKYGAVFNCLVLCENRAAHGIEDKRQTKDEHERAPSKKEAGREAANTVDEMALHRDGKDESTRDGRGYGRNGLVVDVLRDGHLVEEPTVLLGVPLLRHDALGPRHTEARATDALSDDDDNDADDERQHEHALRKLVRSVGLHALRRLPDARVRCAAVRRVLDAIVEVAAHLGGGERQQEEHEKLQEDRHQLIPCCVVVGSPAALGAVPKNLRDAVIGVSADEIRVGARLFANRARHAGVEEPPRSRDEDGVEEDRYKHGHKSDGQPFLTRSARGRSDHQAVTHVVEHTGGKVDLVGNRHGHERLGKEEDDAVAEQEARGQEHGYIRKDAQPEPLAEVHARAHRVRRGRVEAVGLRVRVVVRPRLDARQRDAVRAIPRGRAHRRKLKLRHAVRVHVLFHVGRERRRFVGIPSWNVVGAERLLFTRTVDHKLLQRPIGLGLEVVVEAPLADLPDVRFVRRVVVDAADGGSPATGDRLVVVGDVRVRKPVDGLARHRHLDL